MSTRRFVDRVRFTTTTTGTGTLTAGAAVAGYQALTALADGDCAVFCCSAPGGAWEVFSGTVGASGTTLTRDTVRASSNAGAAVTFAAGTKDVFLVGADAKLLNEIAAVTSFASQQLFGGL